MTFNSSDVEVLCLSLLCSGVWSTPLPEAVNLGWGVHGSNPKLLFPLIHYVRVSLFVLSVSPHQWRVAKGHSWPWDTVSSLPLDCTFFLLTGNQAFSGLALPVKCDREQCPINSPSNRLLLPLYRIMKQSWQTANYSRKVITSPDSGMFSKSACSANP